MPLDDLGFTKTHGGDATRGDTVRALGIEAIPPRLVRRHKRQMLKAFRSDPLNSFIARQYAAAWHWAWVDVDAFPTLRVAVSAAMSFSTSTSTADISAPPAAILDVADEVDLRLEASNIHYQVEYLYNDPILNVMYHDKTGKLHVDCLGIWDNGKVVHVAKSISAKQPGFFTRLFHLA